MTNDETKSRIAQLEHLLAAAQARYEAKCDELAELRQSHGMAPTEPLGSRPMVLITSPDDGGFWPGFPWDAPPNSDA